MVPQLEVDPPGYLGLAGEPIRGPLERALLVGRSVSPASARRASSSPRGARRGSITRTDRRKERMRRDMWSKVEIG